MADYLDPFQLGLRLGYGTEIALAVPLDEFWHGWDGVVHRTSSYLTSWWLLMPLIMVPFWISSEGLGVGDMILYWFTSFL